MPEFLLFRCVELELLSTYQVIVWGSLLTESVFVFVVVSYDSSDGCVVCIFMI